MDSIKTIETYIDRSDWRVFENGNNGFSYPSLKSNIAGHAIAEYCLEKMYKGDIAEAHRTGAIHIHDLSNGFAAYCIGLNLRDLLLKGLSGVKGKVSSSPPKTLRNACLQMANLVGCVQMEVSGAIAFNSVDTLLAPYVRKGNLSPIDIERCIEELVFNLNMPSRAGEIPFSNVSFDLTIPKSLKNENPMIAGEVMEYTYGELQEEADMVLKAYLNVMLRGDAVGRIFPFPIPTFSVSPDFNWESEVSNLIFELSGKYGTPYFQNFINSDLNPDDVRSMCCRLSMDLTELRKSGSVFNSWDSTGSLGVVTLNLPQLSKFDDPIVRLKELLKIACESLHIKRHHVNRLWGQGLFPYLNSVLPHKLTRHFSTIGICGMAEFLEMVEIEQGSPEAKNAALEIIHEIKTYITEEQKRSGVLFNFEETPAESACYRFAKADGFGYDYYTQGAKLPFDYTDDLFEKTSYEEDILVEYTGGSVLHTFLGEKVTSAQAKKLVKSLLTKTRIPYITLTPTFSICQSHGYISGEHHDCPDCGKECEVYSRVVGYHAPVSRWNTGKQSEWNQRIVFNTETI